MKVFDNDTSMFLVPALGLDVGHLRTNYGFINGYLGDRHYEHKIGNCLHLLFLPEDLSDFQAFLAQQYRKSQILDEYDYTGGYVVIVYQFPEIYLRELKLFLKGKFSRFSKQYVSVLPSVTYSPNSEGRNVPTVSLQYMVCNKSPAMKNFWEDRFKMELDPQNEYWFRPKMTRETLDIEKIKRLFLDQLLNNADNEK